MLGCLEEQELKGTIKYDQIEYIRRLFENESSKQCCQISQYRHN